MFAVSGGPSFAATQGERDRLRRCLSFQRIRQPVIADAYATGTGIGVLADCTLLNCYRHLPARIGVATAMRHRAERRGGLARIGAMIFGRERDNRRTAPRTVFAGVKAFTAQSMSDERFGFAVHPSCAAMRVARAGYTRSLPSSDGDNRVLSACFSGSLKAPATCSKARRSCVGNAFPRLSARRRMPEQALALK